MKKLCRQLSGKRVMLRAMSDETVMLTAEL